MRATLCLFYFDGGRKAERKEDGEECMKFEHLKDCRAADGNEEQHEIFRVVCLKIGKRSS